MSSGVNLKSPHKIAFFINSVAIQDTTVFLLVSAGSGNQRVWESQISEKTAGNCFEKERERERCWSLPSRERHWAALSLLDPGPRVYAPTRCRNQGHRANRHHRLQRQFHDRVIRRHAAHHLFCPRESCRIRLSDWRGLWMSSALQALRSQSWRLQPRLIVMGHDSALTYISHHFNTELHALKLRGSVRAGSRSHRASFISDVSSSGMSVEVRTRSVKALLSEIAIIADGLDSLNMSCLLLRGKKPVAVGSLWPSFPRFLA